MDNQPSMQGNLEALRQVMSQQGMGTGILDQANPQANVPQMPQGGGGMPPMGQPSAGQPMPQAQAQVPTGQGLPVGNPESDIILKALQQRLQTISKLDLAKVGM